MRLICPNCVAQYEVDEDVIPTEGRDVQCANCGHNWFQDSIQMLAIDDDIPSGTGDPDSDVPPELFNDLEGKLDSNFVSSRSMASPNPVEMETEEPRDDFQIEQRPEPPTPSSRLNPDVLDVLRSEAEYSSGVKPPAAVVEEDTPENQIDETATELQDQIPETESTFVDTLDEDIEFEASEEILSPEPSDTNEPSVDASEITQDIENEGIKEDDMSGAIADASLLETGTEDVIAATETAKTSLEASDITDELYDEPTDIEESISNKDDLSSEAETVDVAETTEIQTASSELDEKIFEKIDFDSTENEDSSESNTTAEIDDLSEETEAEKSDDDISLNETVPVDDLEEIRKRIAALQAIEDTSDLNSPESTDERQNELDNTANTVETPTGDLADLNFDDPMKDENTNLSEKAPDDEQTTNNPFSRPSNTRSTSQRPTSVPQDSAYEEIIPVENDHSNTTPPDQGLSESNKRMVADQDNTSMNTPEQSLTSQSDEKPYVPNQRPEPRKDMFQDVDELSSEIANEAELNSGSHGRSAARKANALISILRGFIFALILCIIIGALYLFQPIIIEYVPQTEGVMNVITGLVNFAKNIFGPLFGK